MINLNDIVPQKDSVQLVEVVNQGTSENPTKAEVINLPMVGDGNAIRVTMQNPYIVVSNRPHQSSAFTVQLDNILLLQSDGTLVAVPLNSIFTNLTNANLNDALASYKTAYATLVSGITAATLHYSKMNSTGVVTSEVYNLKD